MSTNTLYHAFGLKIYECLRTEYRNGAVFFHVEKKEGAQYCTDCLSQDVVRTDQYQRVWHGLPIGMGPTLIAGHMPFVIFWVFPVACRVSFLSFWKLRPRVVTPPHRLVSSCDRGS